MYNYCPDGLFFLLCRVWQFIVNSLSRSLAQLWGSHKKLTSSSELPYMERKLPLIHTLSHVSTVWPTTGRKSRTGGGGYRHRVVKTQLLACLAIHKLVLIVTHGKLHFLAKIHVWKTILGAPGTERSFLFQSAKNPDCLKLVNEWARSETQVCRGWLQVVLCELWYVPEMKEPQTHTLC